MDERGPFVTALQKAPAAAGGVPSPQRGQQWRKFPHFPPDFPLWGGRAAGKTPRAGNNPVPGWRPQTYSPHSAKSRTPKPPTVGLPQNPTAQSPHGAVCRGRGGAGSRGMRKAI